MRWNWEVSSSILSLSNKESWEKLREKYEQPVELLSPTFSCCSLVKIQKKLISIFPQSPRSQHWKVLLVTGIFERWHWIEVVIAWEYTLLLRSHFKIYSKIKGKQPGRLQFAWISVESWIDFFYSLKKVQLSPFYSYCKLTWIKTTLSAVHCFAG